MSSRHLFGSLAALFVASGLVGVTMGGSGCDRDTEVRFPPDGGDASDGDAPDVVDGGPTITVTSFAPTLTSAPAAKAAATWVAYQLDDGEWRPLAPASAGTYLFPLPNVRWAVALVCASEDNADSTVYVHRRTAATVSLDVSLDEHCTPPPPAAEFAIAGNLANVPPTTEWLDFGYARDSRGVTAAVSGGVSPYEMVGIAPGTWDLSFGIRDNAGGPLSRVVIRRAEVVAGDKMFDVDVTGALSFAPSSKALVLRNLLPGDTVAPKIFYASGGPFGIDVGPQDVPAAPPDPALAYSTIPEGFQMPGDRYHGALLAEQDRRTDGRTIRFDIHNALDLDLTFLAEPPEPVVVVLAVAPQVRLETKFPVLANAVRHEVLAVAGGNRNKRAWRATYDAAYVGGAAEVVDSMPDLSSLPGWSAAWGLAAGEMARVLATGVEKSGSLGDGTVQRSAGRAVSVVVGP